MTNFVASMVAYARKQVARRSRIPRLIWNWIKSAFLPDPNLRKAVLSRRKDAEVCGCAFAPDGKRIASFTHNGRLRIWDASQDRLSINIRQRGAGFFEILFSLFSDSRWRRSALLFSLLLMPVYVFLVFCKPGTGCVFGDLSYVEIIARGPKYVPLGMLVYAYFFALFVMVSSRLRQCLFLPDNKHLITINDYGSYYSDVRVYDGITGRKLAKLAWHSRRIRASALSADGTKFITASEDNTLKVCDIRTRSLIFTLVGHTKPVSACAIWRNVPIAVSASEDQRIKLWSMTEGNELGTLDFDFGNVSKWSFSPDGRKLLTTSEDGVVKLWDVIAGERIVEYIVGNPISDTAWSPFSDVIALGDSEGQVHLLKIENSVWQLETATIWQAPADGGRGFLCRSCQTWSAIPDTLWEARLPCPNCGKPIRLKPSTIKADWRPIARAWRGES